jgi:anti-sigma factor RsiW
MLNGNNNCKEDHGFMVVEYLYGELDDASRVRFESHLECCSACTDEFAAIADVRLGVLEWRQAELDPLATPEIRIPFAAPAQGPSGFIESICGIFAWPVFARATVGFAAVLIVAGVLYLSGIFNTGQVEIASNANIGDGTKIETHSSERADTAVATVETPPTVADRSDVAVKPDEKAVKLTPRRQQQQRSTVSESRNSGKPAANPAKAPRLNNFEEAEDTSLRLADLLAEIGGGK